jgi:DNA (cytosine-5)-methyltransferase 1
MKPTYGSLFSGVGGFDMGFDNAGYDCRWQVEWDKNCQQTLAYHWPNTPRHGDVQDVRGDQLEPVDVIIYGSPCQDLSVAGKRAGIDGSRSSMFFESVRIFREMRDATGNTYPRIVVWENVAGALSSNRGEDFRAVLTALDDIGAVAQWWNVLDAQFFGVPQRRRRVFLVSVFDPAIVGRAGDGQILAVGKGRRRNPQKVKQQRKVVAALTATGVGTCGADDNQAQAGHIMAFSAGNSSNSYGIGLTIDATPPLRAGASGTNQVPTIAFSHTHTHTDVESERGRPCNHGS